MVKGSAGLYYGRTPMIYFPLRGAGVSNTTLFAPASRFGVTFPEVLPSAIAPGSDLAALIGPPAISYVDPEFGNPRVLQLTASVTRRVAGMSLEAGYCAASPGTFASADFDPRRGTATWRRPRGSTSSVVASTSSRLDARIPPSLRRTRSPASVEAAIRR